jgi:cytoskeletal protein CcmA (bactofilin family)
MTLSISQRSVPSAVTGLTHPDRTPRQEHREATPNRILLVGPAIKFKGQIEACDKLVVEGRVEAGLAAKVLSVLKGGLFIGTAEVDRADIAGRFEGTLTVHGPLSIKGGGQVTGRIRYERISIEGGGEIAGDVAIGAAAEDQAAAKPKRKKGKVA